MLGSRTRRAPRTGRPCQICDEIGAEISARISLSLSMECLGRLALDNDLLSLNSFRFRRIRQKRPFSVNICSLQASSATRSRLLGLADVQAILNPLSGAAGRLCSVRPRRQQPCVLRKDVVVHHQCQNKLCVNPEPLLEGAVADNKRDDWAGWPCGVHVDLLQPVAGAPCAIAGLWHPRHPFNPLEAFPGAL